MLDVNNGTEKSTGYLSLCKTLTIRTNFSKCGKWNTQRHREAESKAA